MNLLWVKTGLDFLILVSTPPSAGLQMCTQLGHSFKTHDLSLDSTTQHLTVSQPGMAEAACNPSLSAVIRKLRQEDQSSKPAWATWQDLMLGRECSSLVECPACPRLWVRFSAGREVLEPEGLGSNSVKLLCKAGLILCHPNSTISACQTQITLIY